MRVLVLVLARRTPEHSVLLSRHPCHAVPVTLSLSRHPYYTYVLQIKANAKLCRELPSVQPAPVVEEIREMPAVQPAPVAEVLSQPESATSSRGVSEVAVTVATPEPISMPAAATSPPKPSTEVQVKCATPTRAAPTPRKNRKTKLCVALR
jgi:hypothetical protein